MPYASTFEMLAEAREAGFAVAAFNVENMEMAEAVAEAAEETRSPVIFQTTPSTVKYGGLDVFSAMVRALAASMTTPAALHLDHGDSAGLARAAIDAGYSSVMIDGSKLPFEENISLTASVVGYAADGGGRGRAPVPVEGELGLVGGKEDSLVTAAGAAYTDPDDAVRFARETGVSSLAVGIGTAHGFYHGVPALDIPRLAVIRALLDIPLVLHGASGLSDDTVRNCVRAGAAKVNFATELRAAYTAAVRAALAAYPDAFDPKKFGAPARDAVRALAIHKISVCRG